MLRGQQGSLAYGLKSSWPEHYLDLCIVAETGNTPFAPGSGGDSKPGADSPGTLLT